MHDEPTPHAEPVHADVHHEQSDVDVRAILWFTVFFVVFAVVTHVALWFHFVYLRNSLRTPDLLPVSMVDQDKPKLPPTPRLQPFPNPDQQGSASPLETLPPYDMQKMLEEEQQVLSSYGWSNAAEGRARIPVERAMDIELQRGFPVAGAPLQQQPGVQLPDQIQPAPMSPPPAGGARPDAGAQPATPPPTENPDR